MTATGTRRTATRTPKRVPVSGSRDILTVEGKDDNYVYRWVNDTDNRISKFLNGGYVFVDPKGLALGDLSVENARSETGSVASKYVGKGVTSYLMAIKKEWYEEDQQAKNVSIDQTEEALHTTGQDGRYGKTTIKHGSSRSNIDKI